MKTMCGELFVFIKKSFFLFAYIYYSLFSTQIIYADDQAIIQKLLNQPLRPTVSEYLKAFGGKLPDKNPIPNEYRISTIESVFESGIDLILKLESVFPDLVYAPLGRDSSNFADVLEAHFLSFGLNNRVKRIHASTPSFQTGNELQILEASGLVDTKGQPIVNFIILDPTSWQPTSQSRLLLTAVYSAFKGSDPYLTLKNKIGAVSIPKANSATQHIPIIIGNNHESFFKNIQKTRTYNSILSTGDNQLSYPATLNQIEIQWHDKYQPPLQIENGHFLANPGPLMSEDSRKRILWWLYEVTQLVQSDPFQSKLHERSKKAGIFSQIDRTVLKEFMNEDIFLSLWDVDKYLDFINNFNTKTKDHPKSSHFYYKDYKLKFDLFLYFYGNTSLDLHNQLFQKLKTNITLDSTDFQFSFRSWANPILIKMNKTYTHENILSWIQKLPIDEQERIFYINHFIFSDTQMDLNASWLSLCLRSESSREVLIAILEDLYHNPSKLPQPANFPLFMTSILATYWTLETEKPFTAQEINRLIAMIPKNSPLHVQLVTKAFSKLTTRSDYENLNRPSRISVANDPLYKIEKHRFKEKCPLQNAEKPWWQKLRSIVNPNRNLSERSSAREAISVQ